MNKRKRKVPTHPKQHELVLEHMKRHPQLNSGLGCPQFLDRLWGDLASKLNALGVGPQRTRDDWRNTIGHWKSLIRAKARYIKQLNDQLHTAGEPATEKCLTELEDRLLSLCGRQVRERIHGGVPPNVPIDDNHQQDEQRNEAQREHDQQVYDAYVQYKKTPIIRTHPKQYGLVLQHLELHPLMNCFEGDPQALARWWGDLASKVNALGVGPQRSADEWKKTVNHWKYTARAKARDIQQQDTLPAGDLGPESKKQLSEIEKRLLAVYARQVIDEQKLQEQRVAAQLEFDQKVVDARIRKRIPKTHPMQYAMLLDHIELYPQLQSGVGDDECVDRLWDDLVVKLNALGVGPQRTADEWKKAFSHWKSQTRGKARLINKQKTLHVDDGPVSKMRLNELDKRLLSVCGHHSRDDSRKIVECADSIDPIDEHELLIESQQDAKRYKRIAPIHPKQYALGLDQLELYPQLQSGAGDPKTLARLWAELASRLNTLGVGPQRTADEWKEDVVLWNSQTRAKYCDIKTHDPLDLDDGTVSETPLSELEERLSDSDREIMDDSEMGPSDPSDENNHQHEQHIDSQLGSVAAQFGGLAASIGGLAASISELAMRNHVLAQDTLQSSAQLADQNSVLIKKQQQILESLHVLINRQFQ